MTPGTTPAAPRKPILVTEKATTKETTTTVTTTVTTTTTTTRGTTTAVLQGAGGSNAPGRVPYTVTPKENLRKQKTNAMVNPGAASISSQNKGENAKLTSPINFVPCKN